MTDSIFELKKWEGMTNEKERIKNKKVQDNICNA